ncbi:MAG: TonB family protein, partial [Pseudomonadota bacterium]|nr:TonB family protein [Pseudomonadota bacterium]
PTPVLAASPPLPHRPAPKQVARRIVPLSSTEQRSPPMERSPDVLASVSTAAAAAVARPQPAATGTPAAAASWRSAVAAWLAAHKRYPEEARREGREGAVGVSFTVARDGRVETVSIERPSGVPMLDRSAREMLQNHVVPPFPTEMTQAQTDVHVTIRFEMSRD